MQERFDAIVIGAGQAGPPLAERLGKSGARTAILERHRVGGTCVNTGCIPTKTLVGSARVAQLARRAGEFGVNLDSKVSVDMAAVKARKDRVAGESHDGVLEWIDGMQNVTLIRGHARFTGPRTLAVADRELSAERVFINVGARASVPDLAGLDRIDYLTNSSILDLDRLPDHLLIVGGSYIGLEFAQMYRRFGARVTVVEMQDRLIAREDEDVSSALREILEGEGVRIRTGAECLRLDPSPHGVRMTIDCAQDSAPIDGSHVLFATGRRPNTGDLGLDVAGIETDDRGHIVVDDTLETSVPGVWALGEVNGRGAFTHTSYNDFEIVAANLLDGAQRRLSDRIECYALYTDPPLGRVGMTERQLHDSARKGLIGTLAMSHVGRAREFGDTRGFIKILVDADDERILGAAILGMSGDEVVHALLDVMYTGRSCEVITRAMHIHPTVSELLPTVLKNLKPLG